MSMLKEGGVASMITRLEIIVVDQLVTNLQHDFSVHLLYIYAEYFNIKDKYFITMIS